MGGGVDGPASGLTCDVEAQGLFKLSVGVAIKSESLGRYDAGEDTWGAEPPGDASTGACPLGETLEKGQGGRAVCTKSSWGVIHVGASPGFWKPKDVYAVTLVTQGIGT